MAQFDKSLIPFLEDTPSPTPAELEAAFGPPEEMAAVLTKELPQKEFTSYKTQVWRLRIILAVIIISLIVGLIMVISAKPDEIYVKDVIFDYGTLPVDWTGTYEDWINASTATQTTP